MKIELELNKPQLEALEVALEVDAKRLVQVSERFKDDDNKRFYRELTIRIKSLNQILNQLKNQ